MESIFLQIVQLISDNRFWVLPVFGIAVLVVLVLEIYTIIDEEIEEMRSEG